MGKLCYFLFRSPLTFLTTHRGLTSQIPWHDGVKDGMNDTFARRLTRVLCRCAGQSHPRPGAREPKGTRNPSTRSETQQRRAAVLFWAMGMGEAVGASYTLTDAGLPLNRRCSRLQWKRNRDVGFIRLCWGGICLAPRGATAHGLRETHDGNEKAE